MCMSLCSRRQRQRELVCSRKCVREEERKMWKKRPERKSIILRAVVAMVIGGLIWVLVIFLALGVFSELYFQVV